MSVEKFEKSQDIMNYISETFPSGISVVTYRYDDIEREGIPVLLMPGIRNPEDCEYDITQIAALLDNGVSEIQYLRYSYTEPLRVEDVFLAMNSILDSRDQFKLVGSSIGADLIAKFISLDGENNRKIEDVLLISLYSIANKEVFVRNAFVEKLIKYATSDTSAMRKLYSVVSGGAEAPDMFITNCKQLDRLREALSIDCDGVVNRVKHIKVSWTKDREYATEIMQREIEKQVSFLTESFDVETDLEGPHGVLKKEESLPVYSRVLSQWCRG